LPARWKRRERCVWLTTILAKRASNNGQIIKLGLSDGRRAKFLPSVVGVVYDWMQIQGHLGNVDLFTVRAMLCSESMMG
jgi:hypothetical protein